MTYYNCKFCGETVLKLRHPNVSNKFSCGKEGCSRAKKITLSSKFAQSFKKGKPVLKTKPFKQPLY
jgi:hypothetical protein